MAYFYNPYYPYWERPIFRTAQVISNGEARQDKSKVFDLIKQAVSGEREDEMFYDYLITAAQSQEDKDIISSIRDDERKHNRMFRELYTELTGETLPPPGEAEFKKPESYLDGIRRALFGELGAVERYRIILFSLITRRQQNMLTEIITDELKHASKYNYLYAKNK